MAYVHPNFPTKKSLKEAVGNGEEVTVFQLGPFGEVSESKRLTGREAIEGPHWPEAHRWYATVIIKDGLVVKVS